MNQSSKKFEVTALGKAALHAYCYGGKTFESDLDALLTVGIRFQVPLDQLDPKPTREQLRRLFEAGYIDFEKREG